MAEPTLPIPKSMEFMEKSYTKIIQYKQKQFAPHSPKLNATDSPLLLTIDATSVELFNSKRRSI